MLKLDKSTDTLILHSVDGSKTELALSPAFKKYTKEVLFIEVVIDHPDAASGGSIPFALDAKGVFRLQRWLAKVYQEMV